jgi:hypothetical protein
MPDIQEIWKVVPNSELQRLEVSNLGNVRRKIWCVKLHKMRYTIPDTWNSRGYLKVNLRTGTLYRKLIHRLVAELFIPNPENKKEVNHKNGIKSDNRVSNLEWCTRQENAAHAKDMGLYNNIIRKKSIPLIISDFKKGMRIDELAIKYKTKNTAIYKLVKSINDNG